MRERNSGMADNTDPKLKNQVIYSVYVRNHTSEGTFRALTGDLERIRSLGTDIIWLMPVHPIGTKDKKGNLGCPYAIRDYRIPDPVQGTMEDFKALSSAIHARGMKLMIDVVYNHTSPDSWLAENHPEWFFHKERGDRYGEMCWPWNIDTAYMVDPTNTTGYSFVDIHFYFEGNSHNVGHSEKTLTIVGPKANLKTLIGSPATTGQSATAATGLYAFIEGTGVEVKASTSW